MPPGPNRSPASASREHGPTLGKYIKKKRLALGLTQAQLGELTDIHTNTISGYERDKSTPMEPRLGRLLKGLRTTMEELTRTDLVVLPCAGPSTASGCILRDSVLRIEGVGDARVVGHWTERGQPVVIATAEDGRLLTIRADAAPTTMEDVQSLSAFATQLAEQVRRSA